jgi:hypothetical protein
VTPAAAAATAAAAAAAEVAAAVKPNFINKLEPMHRGEPSPQPGNLPAQQKQQHHLRVTTAAAAQQPCLKHQMNSKPFQNQMHSKAFQK